MYSVKWSGQGWEAVAYVSGPGVESLRLGGGDDLDTEAIAEALEAAFREGYSTRDDMNKETKS